MYDQQLKTKGHVNHLFFPFQFFKCNRDPQAWQTVTKFPRNVAILHRSPLDQTAVNESCRHPTYPQSLVRSF